jgi:hypothetical protein
MVPDVARLKSRATSVSPPKHGGRGQGATTALGLGRGFELAEPSSDDGFLRSSLISVTGTTVRPQSCQAWRSLPCAQTRKDESRAHSSSRTGGICKSFVSHAGRFNNSGLFYFLNVAGIFTRGDPA